MLLKSRVLRSLLLSVLSFSLSEAQEYVLNAPSGSRGAVASEAIECSTIGRDLLAQGGNAVDALVGTVFCVGVVGSYHSGIGGGGFVLIRDKDGNYEAVDFREAAPAAAHEDMYKDEVILSMVGGKAAGVPGEVRGLGYIHSKYGVLPWKDVMAGAIHVARNGFRVNADMERMMHEAMNVYKYQFLTVVPDWAEDYAPNGTLVKEDSFYRGEIAEAIIDVLNRGKGIMTLKDLANYDIISRIVTSNDGSNPPSFLATLGAGGGSRIISATAQVLWHVVEHQSTMADAIAKPRLHDQLMPNVTTLEHAMKERENVVDGLVERGHDIVWVPPTKSAVQGILKGPNGVFEAAGESRQRNSGGLTL